MEPTRLQTLKSNHAAVQPALRTRDMGRRAKIIELNDHLRTTFKGGRVQMTPAVYNLDPQLRGRAIWAMAPHASTKRFDRVRATGYCSSRVGSMPISGE